jgi:hypothetical protein
MNLMDELSKIARDNEPGAKWEIVPHVIGIDTWVAEAIQTPIDYQCSIPVDDIPEGFLLQHINIRQNVQNIRITKDAGRKLYYSAPGWLHHVNPDMELNPALYIKGTGYVLHLMFDRYAYQPSGESSHDIRMLQTALIGQRVIRL